MSAGATALIAVRDLTKTYAMQGSAVQALRGVSLDIERGEFVAVVGPSGSGKSTFMHILGCLDRPTSGRYVLDGRDVSDLGDDELSAIRNRQIGFVFQGFNLLARSSAVEIVELPLLYAHDRRVSASERRTRALLNDPAILLADEPTGNLDSRTSIEVMDIFQRLRDERGITIVLITHEPQVAEYGSRIIRFRDGQIVADERNVSRRASEEIRIVAANGASR